MASTSFPGNYQAQTSPLSQGRCPQGRGVCRHQSRGPSTTNSTNSTNSSRLPGADFAPESGAEYPPDSQSLTYHDIRRTLFFYSSGVLSISKIHSIRGVRGIRGIYSDLLGFWLEGACQSFVMTFLKASSMRSLRRSWRPLPSGRSLYPLLLKCLSVNTPSSCHVSPSRT